jgi:hypothetical protein
MDAMAGEFNSWFKLAWFKRAADRFGRASNSL